MLRQADQNQDPAGGVGGLPGLPIQVSITDNNAVLTAQKAALQNWDVYYLGVFDVSGGGGFFYTAFDIAWPAEVLGINCFVAGLSGTYTTGIDVSLWACQTVPSNYPEAMPGSQKLFPNSPDAQGMQLPGGSFSATMQRYCSMRNWRLVARIGVGTATTGRLFITATIQQLPHTLQEW